MRPQDKTLWFALRVWAYQANGAQTVDTRHSLAALSAWKRGDRPPGTSFVAGAKVVDDPARVDWRDFPEQEAMAAEHEVLGPPPPKAPRARPARPASHVQIETLREIGRDPEGVLRRRLHGARANALLQRGLIELAHVSGQTVRRISATGRALLQRVDTGGGRPRHGARVSGD